MKKASKAGIKIEMEHAKDFKKIKNAETKKKMASIIAARHESESKRYYPELKKMESRLKKRGKK